jgi:hypothetical protein
MGTDSDQLRSWFSAGLARLQKEMVIRLFHYVNCRFMVMLFIIPTKSLK